MAAADYETVQVYVTSIENRVEKRTPTDIRVPKESLVSALAAKMDTDFTGQNGAVTNSELDVDYASTLDDA